MLCSVLDEPAVIDAKLEEFTTAVEEGYQQALLRKDLVAPPTARYLAPPSSPNASRHANASCCRPWQEICVRGQETDILTGHVLGSYQGRWDTLVQLIATRLQEGYTVLITAASLDAGPPYSRSAPGGRARGRGSDHSTQPSGRQ